MPTMEQEVPAKTAGELINLKAAAELLGTKYPNRAMAHLVRHGVEVGWLNKWERGVDAAVVQQLVDAGKVIKRGRPRKTEEE